MQRMQSQKGFTLIEILLYLSIVSIIILAMSSLIQLVLEARVKAEAINEVEQQGEQITELLTQQIREATAITSPAIGASGNSLTISVVTGANSPTVFDLASGTVRMTQGANPATVLHNNRVVASSLIVTNQAAVGSAGSVTFQFTLTTTNQTRPEASFTRTFSGAATVRR